MNAAVTYPRELTPQEKLLLFSILPEHKPGYQLYRQKLDNLFVAAEGRNGENNYILAPEGIIADTTSPSTPVFALGTITIDESNIDVVIHEEIEEEIEIEFYGDTDFDISKPVSSNVNYSDWRSGMRSPELHEKVREILIKPTDYLLAFAKEEKKMWVNNIRTGVNLLIPVSNFYNSLMLYKNERKTTIALNPNLFFNNLETYNNEELVSAFLMYNKYMRRVLL